MRSAATYILNWLSSCASVSSVASSVPVWKVIPASSSQVADRLRLLVADPPHLGDERALRQALLVDAERVEQLVVEDRVVHAHAALVEDADDRLLVLQLLGERAARARPRGRRRAPARSTSRTWPVSCVSVAGLEPGAQARAGPVVGEVLAPQRRVRDPGLREAAGEVEQPDQAGELAAPVGHHEDRAAVGAQAGQDVVAVLPDASTTTISGASGGRVLKTSMPARWLSMNPCPFSGSTGWPRRTVAPRASSAAVEVGLELLLHRPAGRVRAQPQVAATRRCARRPARRPGGARSAGGRRRWSWGSCRGGGTSACCRSARACARSAVLR